MADNNESKSSSQAARIAEAWQAICEAFIRPSKGIPTDWYCKPCAGLAATPDKIEHGQGCPIGVIDDALAGTPQPVQQSNAAIEIVRLLREKNLINNHAQDCSDKQIAEVIATALAAPAQAEPYHHSHWCSYGEHTRECNQRNCKLTGTSVCEACVPMEA